jgi:predicted nucleic acid-binding protein
VSLVLDCSATMAQVFQDETTLVISEVFDRVANHGAWVPELWRFEVFNTLNMGIRRGRIGLDDRRRILLHLDSLPIRFDTETYRFFWTKTAELADLHKLTIYDAAYLELALRLILPLATLDRDLRQAAQAEGVALLGI